MLHPLLPPRRTGRLDVGDGHVVAWEEHGDPDGIPVVALHGGPGGGRIRGLPRRFDPARFRLVQLDQRGCGDSTPHAGDLATALDAITTPHLVADLERLRGHLGVDRWLVWGASWGACLGLAYAQRHPDRVRGMILLSTALTRPSDVAWFGRGVGALLPDAWARFRDGVPPDERDGDLVAAYDRLLNAHPDPAVRLRAARDWVAWEDALLAHEGHVPAWPDDRATLAFARLVTHFFSHAAWLGERELLDGAARLRGIPGVLLHGRLDLANPPEVVEALARAWPGAELHLVPGGHTGGAEMDQLQVEAIAAFSRP